MAEARVNNDGQHAQAAVEDRQEVFDAIHQIFPYVDDNFIEQNWRIGTTRLCDMICENEAQVPRKQKKKILPTKKEKDEVGTPELNVVHKRLAQQSVNIRDVFMSVFDRAEFKHPLQEVLDTAEYQNLVTNMLANDFPRLHLGSIRTVVRMWRGHYAPAYALLKVRSLSFTFEVGKAGVIPDDGVSFGGLHLQEKFKVNQGTRPRRRLPSAFPAQIQKEVDLIMDISQTVPTASNQKENQVKLVFSCGVCFEELPLTVALSCSAEDEHTFCLDCVRGHAKAATQSAVVSGSGLRCMETDCDGTMPWAEVRKYVNPLLRRRLSERFREESLNSAGLQLERCKVCYYAVEIDVPREQNKVFECANCQAAFCRLCNLDWDDNHIGLSCDEAVKRGGEAVRREYENQMSEVVIRRCPKCKTAFDKVEGCNKMTCRCGMKQCYLCRATDIDYSHFCQHMREPGVKCNQCIKPCLLWENATLRDNQQLKEIEKKAKNDQRVVQKMEKQGPSEGSMARVVAPAAPVRFIGPPQPPSHIRAPAPHRIRAPPPLRIRAPPPLQFRGPLPLQFRGPLPLQFRGPRPAPEIVERARQQLMQQFREAVQRNR